MLARVLRERVEALGAGLRLARRDYCAERLHDTIERMSSESSFARSARRISFRSLPDACRGGYDVALLGLLAFRSQHLGKQCSRVGLSRRHLFL